MTALQLSQLIVDLVFLIITLATLLDFLRHRSEARLDILLVFASLGLPFFSSLLNLIQPRLPFTPLPSYVASGGLLVHPYFLLRLVRHFQVTPRWIMAVGLVGLVLFILLVIAVPAPLPTPLVLAIIAWYVLIEGYCAVAFFRGAARTGGVTRARLQLASAGSLFLGLTLLSLAPTTLVPGLQPFGTAVSEPLVLIAGACYYLGFAAPRWLRRTWQLAELQEFLVQNTRLPRESRTTQAIDNLTHAVSDGVGALAVLVGLWDEARGQFVIGSKPVKTLEASGDSIWARAWEQRRPLLARHRTGGNAADTTLMAEYGAGSMLAIPLATPQHRWGVVLALLRREPLFPDDDLSLLVLLNEQAAILLDYGTLLEAQQVAIERASALAEISDTLTRVTLDLKTLLQTIAQRTCILIGDSCVVTLVSLDGRAVQPTAWYRADPEGQAMLEARLKAPQPVDQGRAGQVISTGRALLVPTLTEEQARGSMAPEFVSYVDRFGVSSVLLVPLRAQDHVIGTLGLTRDRGGRPYTHDDLVFLQDIADRAALAIANARAFAQLTETQELLAQQKGELERSNADLEQFAYVASHDLQEPLQMVSSFVQLLARRYQGKLDSTADEYIGYAVSGAARMRALINDLLSYSRVGTRGGKFEETDCESVLAVALNNLSVAIEQAHATVTHDPLPTVLADRSQLLQVFQNLIGNALKFRAGKPACVHIGAVARDEEWLFCVHDEGEGIDPQYFDRIFIIFQRLHRRNEYEGTGIGLAICKKIIERHGGRIWVESEPGKGATFYFTMPKRELISHDELVVRAH